MAEESVAAWRGMMRSTAERIAEYPSLDVSGAGKAGAGSGRTVRWTLNKLVGEYARRNGHADLLRECIDGMTGERELSKTSVLRAVPGDAGGRHDLTSRLEFWSWR
jgi:hypothetical protein